MYKCGVCGELQDPRVLCELVPIKIREKLYYNKDIVTKGFEIVETIKVCPNCTSNKKEAKVIKEMEEKWQFTPTMKKKE